MITTIKRLAEV